jgi:hypothetical protein
MQRFTTRAEHRVHARNRGRWADHGPVKSRTLDVGVKKIRALEIGLPKTGRFDASVGQLRVCYLPYNDACEVHHRG